MTTEATTSRTECDLESRPRITLDRDKQFVCVDPRVPELECLQTTAIAGVADPATGVVLRRQRRPLYEAIGNPETGSMRFPIGLELPVGLILELNHRDYETRDTQRIAQLNQPVPPPENSSPRSNAVADWMYRNERGIFEKVTDHVMVENVVMAAYRAFPQATIAAVARDAKSLYRLAARLRPSIPEIRVHNSRNRPSDSPQLVLATPHGLDPQSDSPQLVLATPHGLDPHFAAHLRILLWLNATDALHEQMWMVFEGAERARMYGFLAASRHLTEFQRDWLNARFGFARLALLPTAVPARENKFCFVGAPVARAIAAGADAHLVQQANEHDQARNRRIANLARQLAAGNLNCLPAAARDGIAGTGAVVVVVATVSHAIVLAEMLDGWAVVTGSVLDHELSERERETLRRHRLWAAHFIVTLQGLANFDLGAAHRCSCRQRPGRIAPWGSC